MTTPITTTEISTEMQSQTQPARGQREEKGANAAGVHSYKCMSKNAMSFMDYLADHADGISAPRTARQRFDDVRTLGSENSVALECTKSMKQAWSNRPSVNVVIEEGGPKVEITRLSHAVKYALLNTKRKLAQLGYVGEGEEERLARFALEQQLIALESDIAAVSAHELEAPLQDYFPGAGGLLEIQEATRKLRAIEQRDGGAMKYGEKIERFPCLAKGWPCPNAMAMAEEKRKVDFEDRPGKMLQGLVALEGAPSLPVRSASPSVEIKSAAAAAASTLSFGEPPIVADEPHVDDAAFVNKATGDDLDWALSDEDIPPPVDRRFDEEAPRKKARANSSPKTVQSYAVCEGRKSTDLTCFDPLTIAAYTSNFHPKDAAGPPTWMDLVAKGFYPVLPKKSKAKGKRKLGVM